MGDTAVEFTVAIPTYNGATRLGMVLDKLHQQVNTESFTWEILVIDNNSTDNTSQLVREYRESWERKFKLRYCHETKQGAAFARKRAIKEAKAPIIGFLDDDNLPHNSWVAAAYTFAQKYPQAGAIASKINPLWEVEPPPNFERIRALLAINDRGNEPLIYKPQSKLLPPSAGLVVRKEAWQNSVPEKCILSGRVPGKMLTSEDLEVLSYIRQAKWEIWYNPEMEIEHCIPHWRLQRDYLIPFVRGIGLSRYVTRMVGVKSWLKPVMFLAYLGNDLRKVIHHLLRYGVAVRKDLVSACELELFISSLISPFYLWKNGYLQSAEHE